MSRIFAILAVCAAITLASCGGGAQDMRIASASQTVVVTPFDLISTPAYDGWFFYNDENDTIDNSLGSFVSGPGNPPQGSDSVQISVTGTQRRNLATYQFTGTPLADITELGYSTYNPSAGNGGSANRSGYLNFNVDFNGTDTFQRRLVFLPSDNGTITQDSWNSWDAINGGSALWRYSGAFWPGTLIPGTTTRAWSEILSVYPGVRIRVTDSWLGIRVGEPYANGYTENIDEFVFGTAEGTTTFDFERTSLQACADHWKEMGFKNHGQCVSSFKNKGQQGNGH
jgi:hypothetical protein